MNLNKIVIKKWTKKSKKTNFIKKSFEILQELWNEIDCKNFS